MFVGVCYPAKNRAEYRLILSRRGLNQTIFRKIGQDNCFIIQQIVNEKYFTAKNTVVMQRSAILRTNCCNLRIFNNYSTSASWI